MWKCGEMTASFDKGAGVIYVIACDAPAQRNGFILVGNNVTNGHIISQVTLSGAPITNYGGAAIAHMEISY